MLNFKIQYRLEATSAQENAFRIWKKTLHLEESPTYGAERFLNARES